MKMFLKSSLIILGILFAGNLFFSSCNKDKNNPATATKPLLLTMSSYGKDDVLSENISYQYDNQGRLNKMIHIDGSYDLVEYSASIITIKSYKKDIISNTATANLNTKGLAISISNDGYSDTYEYDSNGYRKSSIYDSASWVYTTTYTVSDGNYVTISSEDKSKTIKSAIVNNANLFQKAFFTKTFGKGVDPQNILKSATAFIYTDKNDYQFFTDKTNSIDYENFGVSFLGKQNTNPIKQETKTSSTDGGSAHTNITTYTYEYDNIGRITKQMDNNGNHTVYTYVE
jgi:hypothetical protein